MFDDWLRAFGWLRTQGHWLIYLLWTHMDIDYEHTWMPIMNTHWVLIYSVNQRTWHGMDILVERSEEGCWQIQSTGWARAEDSGVWWIDVSEWASGDSGRENRARDDEGLIENTGWTDRTRGYMDTELFQPEHNWRERAIDGRIIDAFGADGTAWIFWEWA